MKFIEEIFTCPDCGCHILEEIMTDVVQTTRITGIEDGIFEYGYTCVDGGVCERIQCMECGFVLKDDNDNTIQYANELANCPHINLEKT